MANKAFQADKVDTTHIEPEYQNKEWWPGGGSPASETVEKAGSDSRFLGFGEWITDAFWLVNQIQVGIGTVTLLHRSYLGFGRGNRYTAGKMEITKK